MGRWKMEGRGVPSYPEVPGDEEPEHNMLIAAPHSSLSSEPIGREQVWPAIPLAGANGQGGQPSRSLR